MKKLGIIFDSFVCLTKKEAQEQGFYYIPLLAEIDGKTFQDGIDLDRRELLEAIGKTNKIRTSLPFPGDIEEVFRKASVENDEVIFFPICAKLSSAFSTATNIAKEFNNVHVVDTAFVGQQLIDVALWAQKHYQKHEDIHRTISQIPTIISKSISFIITPDIKYAINGGRVSSFKKFVLGTLSKIKIAPIIRFDINGASTAGIGRGPKGAMKQIITKLCDFTGLSVDKIPSEFQIYTINGIDEDFNKLAIEIFKENGIEFMDFKLNCSPVAIHTGPQAHCYSVIPKLSNWDLE